MKMNTYRITTIAAILCASTLVSAAPVNGGVGIDQAIEDMKAEKYRETELQMSDQDEANELKFWDVDDGVLIATYSKANRKILKLTYWFSDGRARSERQTFSFSVSSFDPKTGVMSIQTKKP